MPTPPPSSARWPPTPSRTATTCAPSTPSGSPLRGAGRACGWPRTRTRPGRATTTCWPSPARGARRPVRCGTRRTPPVERPAVRRAPERDGPERAAPWRSAAAVTCGCCATTSRAEDRLVELANARGEHHRTATEKGPVRSAPFCPGIAVLSRGTSLLPGELGSPLLTCFLGGRPTSSLPERSPLMARSTSRPSVPLGSLTERYYLDAAMCAACSPYRVTQLSMKLTAVTPVD